MSQATKRQLNAITRGQAAEAGSRAAYEASLASPELRRRLESLAKG